MWSLFPDNTVGNTIVEEVPCNGAYECFSESAESIFNGVVEFGKVALSSELLNDPIFACTLVLIEAAVIFALVRRQMSKAIDSSSKSSAGGKVHMVEEEVNMHDLYSAAIETVDRTIGLRKDLELLKSVTFEKVQLLREMLEQRNNGIEIMEKDLVALRAYLNESRNFRANGIQRNTVSSTD